MPRSDDITPVPDALPARRSSSFSAVAGAAGWLRLSITRLFRILATVMSRAIRSDVSASPEA